MEEAPGHDRRRRPISCRAVLRLRHAEPDRVRGHLSAARSAARPLHRARAHRYPSEAQERALLERAPGRLRCARSATAGDRTGAERARDPRRASGGPRDARRAGSAGRTCLTLATAREPRRRRARGQPARCARAARRGASGGGDRRARLRDARRRQGRRPAGARAPLIVRPEAEIEGSVRRRRRRAPAATRPRSRRERGFRPAAAAVARARAASRRIVFALLCRRCWPLRRAVAGAVAVAAVAVARAGVRRGRASAPGLVARIAPEHFSLRAIRRLRTDREPCDVALRWASSKHRCVRSIVDGESVGGRCAALARDVRGRVHPGARGRTLVSDLRVVRESGRVWQAAPRLRSSRACASIPILGARALRPARRTESFRGSRSAAHAHTRRGHGFESLREYEPGDAFRCVDWKATARRGRVMVAQYEVERSQSVMCCSTAAG